MNIELFLIFFATITVVGMGLNMALTAANFGNKDMEFGELFLSMLMSIAMIFVYSLPFFALIGLFFYLKAFI